MTWKTRYRQELEELSGQRPRWDFAGFVILCFTGLFWFSAIGLGLYISHFL